MNKMNYLSKQQKEILTILALIQSHVINIDNLRKHMWIFKHGVKGNIYRVFYNADWKHLNITPSFRASFSRTLRRLEQRDLIFRDKAGNNNQTKYVNLTQKGWDKCKNIYS